jgi:hypothetical protein
MLPFDGERWVETKDKSGHDPDKLMRAIKLLVTGQFCTAIVQEELISFDETNVGKFAGRLAKLFEEEK